LADPRGACNRSETRFFLTEEFAVSETGSALDAVRRRAPALPRFSA
jgi:hypothetical protein